MNFTVTLDLPEETVARAQIAATRRHTTLSEAVRSYLVAIADEEPRLPLPSQPENPPSTLEKRVAAVRNSSGILQLPADFKLKEFIAGEKSKDYAGS